MKSHITESILPAKPSFHVHLPSGLFGPIAFVFVSERMRQDIERERQLILDATPVEDRSRQQSVFECYDLDLSAKAFKDILRLFGVPDRP